MEGRVCQDTFACTTQEDIGDEFPYNYLIRESQSTRLPMLNPTSFGMFDS